MECSNSKDNQIQLWLSSTALSMRTIPCLFEHNLLHIQSISITHYCAYSTNISMIQQKSPISISMESFIKALIILTNKNIVDRNVNQLNKIANKSHHNKANTSSHSGLSEFYASKHKKQALPFLSGFVQRLTRNLLSLTKSFTG